MTEHHALFIMLTFFLCLGLAVWGWAIVEGLRWGMRYRRLSESFGMEYLERVRSHLKHLFLVDRASQERSEVN